MTDVVEPARRWRPSLLLRGYARLLVLLRWPVVLGWLAAAAASVVYLPAVGQGGSDLEQLVSAGNPAVASEVRSYARFGFPLLSRVAVVQRRADGLPQEVQRRAVERARAVSDGTDTAAGPIRAAVPVTNTLGLFPGSAEDGTTIVTLLFTDPDVSFADQVAAAQRFVAGHYDAADAVVGITGSVPARVEQTRIVQSSVPVLEVITIAAVFLIVAIAFRSPVASLLALVVAAVATLLTLHVGGALALRLGVPVPQETQPLLVALLLGVVTDYVVFYLSAARGRLAAGDSRLAAARHATARFTPIIATAGATAAAGTGALVVAGAPTFRAFGPGMALAILIGVVVALTLVPALLAILGPAAFWSPLRRRTAAEPLPAPPAADGGPGCSPGAGSRCRCCCASPRWPSPRCRCGTCASACRSSRRCRPATRPAPPRPPRRPGSPTASCPRPSCSSRATASPAGPRSSPGCSRPCPASPASPRSSAPAPKVCPTASASSRPATAAPPAS
ncbi:MMPL family transporter [Dactylosporangium darangshiense]|uniref:MMPL family transporter n=1 Tax=Dactylosporangium darangshiense TaxID=579108 RepID=UPI003638EFA4